MPSKTQEPCDWCSLHELRARARDKNWKIAVDVEGSPASGYKVYEMPRSNNLRDMPEGVRIHACVGRIKTYPQRCTCGYRKVRLASTPKRAPGKP
jgi:hypothetical protein